MRDELHVMELVDRYLDGAMGSTERAAFEERIGSNAELGLLVNDQRALREGMLRVHLRQAAVGARRVWLFKRTLPWMIVAALVLGTSAYLMFGDHREGHVNTMEQIGSTPPATESKVMMGDSAAPYEVEALKVETVFVEYRLDSQFVKPEGVTPPPDDPSTHAPVPAEGATGTEQVKEGSVAFDVRANTWHSAAADSVEHAEVDVPSGAVVKPLLATVEQPGNADQQPNYPGGWDAMHDFLKANLRVPRNLRGTHTVLVSFVVDRKGDIRDAKVMESGSTKLDQEALRVIGMMPRWLPCRVGDKPVKSRIEVPIRFAGDDPGVEK